MSGNDMASNADGSMQTAQSALAARLSLVTELENAIANGSAKRRADMLLHITDLFMRKSDRFSEGEIKLFDELFTRLASGIDVSLRLLLADNLAPAAKAPFNITRMLANDDDIRVAYPILACSRRLDDAALVLIAQTKGQAHLLTIARRQSVDEAVANVLVERGDKQVLASIVANPGAKFSYASFALLVKRSDGDDALAASVGSRPDIPHYLFLDLLATASKIVRGKFTAENLQVKREFSFVEPYFLFGGNGTPVLAV
jgi:uncharacterized protein (DUF2336 family)